MSQETSAMVYYACFHSIVNYGIIFFGGGVGGGGCNSPYSINIFKLHTTRSKNNYRF